MYRSRNGTRLHGIRTGGRWHIGQSCGSPDSPRLYPRATCSPGGRVSASNFTVRVRPVASTQKGQDPVSPVVEGSRGITVSAAPRVDLMAVYLSEQEAIDYCRYRGTVQGWRSLVSRHQVPRARIGRQPLYLARDLDRLVLRRGPAESVPRPRK